MLQSQMIGEDEPPGNQGKVMPPVQRQLHVVVVPLFKICIANEKSLCINAPGREQFYVAGVVDKASLELQRSAAGKFVLVDEAQRPVGQIQTVPGVIVPEVEIRHHHMTENQASHPLQMPRNGALHGSRSPEKASPVGVPGRARLLVELQFREKRRRNAVEPVKVVGIAVPVGGRCAHAEPRHQRHRLIVEMREPAALGGKRRREPGMMQEVGVHRPVSIVEEVAEGAQVESLVCIVAQVGHGRIDPARLGLFLSGNPKGNDG